mgnify:FL=1
MVGGVDAKELRAPVFNIVHGSFVDGWGTRTTIFLKGCPLNCVWCCNPEGRRPIRSFGLHSRTAMAAGNA